MSVKDLVEFYKLRSYSVAKTVNESLAMKKPKTQESVEDFLKRGGKIKQIPFGVSVFAVEDSKRMRNGIKNHQEYLKSKREQYHANKSRCSNE